MFSGFQSKRVAEGKKEKDMEGEKEEATQSAVVSYNRIASARPSAIDYNDSSEKA